MDGGLMSVLAVALGFSMGAGPPIADDWLTAPGVSFETYLVRWWGAPGSEMTRPIHRIARFDNDRFQLHYGIVPGRDLADYTMPYSPIRSVLSFVDSPAELAQQVEITYTDADGEHSIGFTPRSGVELAPSGDALAVKISNRSIAAPEDITTVGDDSYEEDNPLSIEEVFVLRKGEGNVPIHARLRNAGDAELRDVTVTFVFEESFSWSRFGAAEENTYVALQAPASGEARAFYAFSEGMNRGYALAAGSGTTLTYEVTPEMNRWRVAISCEAGTLPPSSTKTFECALQVLDAVPEHVEAGLPKDDIWALDYRRFQATGLKTAPVSRERRVSIDDLAADLSRPKVRGLNLRAGFPEALADLETLKDWGCNLVIANLGDPEDTAKYIARGHALGMEMLLAGHGHFSDGSPDFSTYYETPRTQEQIPDAHGQDEDHYYWRGVEPKCEFPDEFGKSMSQATHDEEVDYWARCFCAKWRGVRDALKSHAPDVGMWFYAPFPSVAHVEPVDSYDLFMGAIVQGLGDVLTVFPFHYGIEYNQCEYMMRRWKDCGAKRAVFLPMRDFMTRPTQFIRAITAARRGGADGACGFNFGISDATPENQWQWKAVMLGAWANFPTPDLSAYCLMEKPAELVEALAQPGLVVHVVTEADGFDGEVQLAALSEALPGVRLSSTPSKDDGLTILLTDKRSGEAEGGGAVISDALWSDHKGIVQMQERTVRLSGADATALRSACDLLLRFADVARDERKALESN